MSVSSIASSGLNVAQLRQVAAASNIANAGADDAQRLGVDASSLPDGGVAGELVAVPDDVDGMTTDLVYSLSARSDFEANAVVVSRSDEMIGSLLDMLA
ncbi:MAG: hypothetical protein QM581_03360 [Pseudomonas sp.]